MASVDDEVVVSQLAVQTVPRFIRRRRARVRVSDGRLQGRPRVHRRIHLHVDEVWRPKPDAQPRPLSQTYWWMGIATDNNINNN